MPLIMMRNEQLHSISKTPTKGVESMSAINCVESRTPINGVAIDVIGQDIGKTRKARVPLDLGQLTCTSPSTHRDMYLRTLKEGGYHDSDTTKDEVDPDYSEDLLSPQKGYVQDMIARFSSPTSHSKIIPVFGGDNSGHVGHRRSPLKVDLSPFLLNDRRSCGYSPLSSDGWYFK